MAIHQIKGLDEYIRYLQKTPADLDALFRDLLIGVTSFFRDTEAFRVFQYQAIPQLFGSNRHPRGQRGNAVHARAGDLRERVSRPIRPRRAGSATPTKRFDGCTQEAIASGWTYFKMKVGRDLETNIRRAALVREEIGDDRKLMMDANQCWDVPEAITQIQALARFDPWWIEEPTSRTTSSGTPP